jgi:hypothetical protein
MNQMSKLYPEGWLLYCPDCYEYIKQSDPQNDSRRKSVVIDDTPCKACTEKREAEIQEAQQIMGRLGLPKGEEKNG